MSTDPNVLTFYQIGPGLRGNRWTLRASNGEVIAASTECYRERRGAHENAAQVLGAGILAGHHVIPSVIDRPAVMAAIEERYGLPEDGELGLPEGPFHHVSPEGGVL